MECYCTAATGMRAVVQAGGGSRGFGSRPPTALLAARCGAGAAGRAWPRPCCGGCELRGGGGAQGPALGGSSPALVTPTQGTGQETFPAGGWLVPRAGGHVRRPMSVCSKTKMEKPTPAVLLGGCDAAAPQHCQGDEKWMKTRLGEEASGLPGETALSAGREQ